MSLTKEIADFEAEKKRSHDPDVLEMIDVTTADLVAGGVAEGALKVGEQAPDFDLPDHLGNRVRLADLLSDGPVIVNFYRGSWCPYCNLELRAYQRELERIDRAGARLVAMDNLYMYGPIGNRPITEELPYLATTRKGRVRAQMATDLLAAHRAGRVQVAIGRASDFFGPRALGSAAGERVFYPALSGKAAQIIGQANLPHTFTYVPDIGKGLVTLGQHDEALGQAWHLPSPPTVTTRRFLEMVYAETGHPLKIQAMPKPLLKLLSFFNPMMRELDEMLYEFDEPFIVDDSKFTAAFGLAPTPWPEAIRATVDWFRQNPQHSA